MLVVRGNAHATSGGTGPGLVDVPEDEGRALIAEGYAVALATEPAARNSQLTEPAPERPAAKGKKRS